MSRSACAFPDAIDPLTTSVARDRVRISAHRWSTEFGTLLSAWAATCPTLVVLTGGRAILSDVHAPAAFSDQVGRLWFGAHRNQAADAVHSPAGACMALRFEPGADVAVLQEQRDGATVVDRRAAGTPLAVQLRPAAYLRFLYRRRALSLGWPDQALLADQDAHGLLRHVLLRAWPCGQSRILASSHQRARQRSLAFEAQMAMTRALASRHPLAELARALNTSPFHLAHVFRSEIGVSLHQYLLQLRLIAALERLGEGEPDLSTLALDLGFSHHSHFSTQFRRVVGLTPREVRRMLTAESAVTIGAVGAAT
jgi:AraC-like DNA-binding protein